MNNVSRSSSVEQASAMLAALTGEVKTVLVGQDSVVEQVLIALIAEGHVLIEGVPGLGKTLLVRGLAKCFGGRFARLQFTPDLMPSDITGHAMFNIQTQAFEVRKGPVFTNLLLADEVNRAPAKTQAALLEVMQERQVTIEGESYPTGDPFMVLATQNPVEQEGTYPLPEAELDRFMLKVLIDYPAAEDELLMLKQLGESGGLSQFHLDKLRTLVTPQHLLAIQKLARRITVDDQVTGYVVDIVRATRDWPGLARGAGPRGCVALLAAARARALMQGRHYATPDDVKTLATACLRHRLLLSAEMEIEGVSPDQILRDLLQQVKAPRR